MYQLFSVLLSIMPSQSIKECDRCVATTKSGARCRRRTCRGEKCWIHLKSQDNLRVKRSGIANAGLGLYALKKLKKNEKIAAYKGDHLTKAQFDARYPGKGTAEYVFCGNSKNCIDGRKTSSSVARFSNDARGSRMRNNARLTWDGRRRQAFIKASTSIPKDREILTGYGRTYWA